MGTLLDGTPVVRRGQGGERELMTITPDASVCWYARLPWMEPAGGGGVRSDRQPPTWTRHDAAVWTTCEILSALIAREPQRLSPLVADFPTHLSADEMLLAAGAFELLVHRAAGNGTYAQRNTPIVASGRGALGVTLAAASVQGVANRRQRNRAEADAQPRWMLDARGTLVGLDRRLLPPYRSRTLPLVVAVRRFRPAHRRRRRPPPGRRRQRPHLVGDPLRLGRAALRPVGPGPTPAAPPARQRRLAATWLAGPLPRQRPRPDPRPAGPDTTLTRQLGRTIHRLTSATRVHI